MDGKHEDSTSCHKRPDEGNQGYDLCNKSIKLIKGSLNWQAQKLGFDDSIASKKLLHCFTLPMSDADEYKIMKYIPAERNMEELTYSHYLIVQTPGLYKLLDCQVEVVSKKYKVCTMHSSSNPIDNLTVVRSKKTQEDTLLFMETKCENGVFKFEFKAILKNKKLIRTLVTVRNQNGTPESPLTFLSYSKKVQAVVLQRSKIYFFLDLYSTEFHQRENLMKSTLTYELTAKERLQDISSLSIVEKEYTRDPLTDGFLYCSLTFMDGDTTFFTIRTTNQFLPNVDTENSSGESLSTLNEGETKMEKSALIEETKVVYPPVKSADNKTLFFRKAYYYPSYGLFTRLYETEECLYIERVFIDLDKETNKATPHHLSLSKVSKNSSRGEDHTTTDFLFQSARSEIDRSVNLTVFTKDCRDLYTVKLEHIKSLEEVDTRSVSGVKVAYCKMHQRILEDEEDTDKTNSLPILSKEVEEDKRFLRDTAEFYGQDGKSIVQLRRAN